MKACFISLLLIIASTQIFSRTYFVTNTNDSGQGSLREVLDSAETNFGQDTIRFIQSLDGDTIKITSGEIDISDPVIIFGRGFANTYIQSDSSRVLDFTLGADSSEIWSISFVDITNYTNAGGAININACFLKIYNSRFRGCRALNTSIGRGGAIYFSTFGSFPASLFCKNTVFRQCVAYDDAGAIYVDKSPNAFSEFDACSFISNSVTNGSGGAIRLNGDSDTLYSGLIKCYFQENYAELSGGAVYLGAFAGYAEVDIISCRFFGNEAGLQGGAFYLSAGGLGEASPNIYNSFFTGNYADDTGGAIHAVGALGTSNPRMINCSVAFNNNGSGDTGALYFIGSAGNIMIPEIHNTVIWGNNAGINGIFFTPDVKHSLVEGEVYPSGENLDGTEIANNPRFFEDVDFTNAPTIEGDIRLKKCTPLVNAGNEVLLDESIFEDVFFDSRITYGAIDIGASEIPDPPDGGPLFEVGCGDCPYYFTYFNEDLDNSGRSRVRIQTLGDVESDENTTLKSASFIFGPGFSTQPGFTFETILEPCEIED